MSFREYLAALPIVGDFFDAAELVEGCVELATASTDGYAALRDSMMWTEVADGVDTRAAMLTAASEAPVEYGTEGEIVAGQWTDPFTGFTSSNPADFDIDHRVPFKAIADSVPGFGDLPHDEQLAYFNDRDNLQVLHDEHNASKGDALPSEYAERIGDTRLRGDFTAACERYMDKVGVSL